MTTSRTIEDELTAPEFGRDPYPTYRRMLEREGPVFSEARGAWLISRFDQVMDAFADYEHFSSEGRVGTMLDHFTNEEWAQLEEMQRYAELKGIIHVDPPDHRRLRALVMRGFKRRTIEQLRSRVQQIVDDLLDEAQEQGRIEVVADLATQVPTSVICEMLGIDYGDRGRFVAWSDAALALQGTARPSLETALAAQDGYVGLQRFFGDLVADRQAHPRGTQERPDLLTDLITATEDGERLSEGDLVQTCLTLLMGGYETTASLIANTVVLLGTHLEVRDQVAGDRSLLEPLIEESLRIESPIQTVTRRVASDVEVGDQTLHEGDLAITMIGAANRDPRRFEDPDTFDLHRDRGHVAFGYSTHFCLGAALARMEAPIAIGSLLDRVPAFELAEDDIDWNAGKVVIRCPRTLALRF